MPATLTYPGVYIEEIPSGVRTITGVATSITAFLGRAPRGPVNEPTVINNFGDFERLFGGLDADYPVSYAVQDFFLNGGAQAIIVRIYHPLFADDDAREAALKEAKTAAHQVRDAAILEAGVVGATATSVADKAEEESDEVTDGLAGTAIAAAQAVADAARAEATKAPYHHYQSANGHCREPHGRHDQADVQFSADS